MASSILLGPSEISRAVSDANFYTILPEFSALRIKMDTMRANSKRGCSSCRMRRVVSNINSDFMHVVETLSDSGKERLKKYFGVDAIRYTHVDRIARKATTVSI